jgi:hypothetical protein
MNTVFNYMNCFFLLIFFMGNAKAQSPGGVSDSLGLWLKADTLAAITPDTGVGQHLGDTSWPDVSTNNHHAIFHPSTVNVSKYAIDSGINFNSTIRINDEWFDSPVDINKKNVSVFMVYKFTGGTGSRPLWGNDSLSVGKKVHTDRVHDGVNYTSYTPTETLNKTYLNHINTIDSNMSYVFVNGDIVHSYLNGLTVDSNAHAGIFIGKEKASSILGITTRTLSLAEFIVYTDSITGEERAQINSYLAIKYGITLGHDYTINSGDSTVWSQTINVGYNNNIIGLARDNASGLNTTKSKSEEGNAFITLSTTSNIPNNEALLIGNNNLLTTGTVDFSTNNFFVKGKRLNRVWKCQKTAGFTIKVDIGIDNNIPLPANGFQPNNMVLLVSDSSNMERNLKAYPLTNNTTSGNYEVSDVTLEDGQFFTIAYLDVALWIKADASLNTITLGNPYVYHDNVLGLNNMSSAADSTNPTHVMGTDSSGINFNPCIQFNEGNSSMDQYIGKSNLAAFGNSGVSTFLVLRRDDMNTALNEAMVSYATNSQFNEMVITNPDNLTVSIKEVSQSTGRSSFKDITDSIPHVFTNRRGDGSFDQIRLDGSGPPNVSYKNDTIINSRGTLIFGQEQDSLGGGFDTTQAYQGDIAEALIFNKKIPNDERNAIETYLGIKYGITLQNSYVLPTNSLVLWDKTANVIYHNNVAGIGREDNFSLNQEKSTSQNGARVDVTISHVGPFSVNNSYMIWGCNLGVYDSLSTTDTLAGYQHSTKIWKVQNWNNRIVDSVDVTLKIPPSLSSMPINKFKLIVNNSSDFSTATTLYFASPSAPGFITFKNIILRDNYFFSLALEDSPATVTYSDSGNVFAFNSFEACIGDTVTFTYTNLTSHPNQLELMGDLGLFNITLDTATNLIYTAGLGSSGIISIKIPSNASTGNVRLIDTSIVIPVVLHDFNSNLIIHRPVVDFYLSQVLICATDTVPLVGIPTGGTFSTSPTSNLIDSSNNLIGINASWTSDVNDSIQDVFITYSYTPSYLNGNLCGSSIESTDTIIIRDNRFETLDFQPIITNEITPSLDDRELLSSMVQRALPEFRTSRNYPVNFLGNYVNNTSGVDSFFTDNAGFGSHPVTMKYDNGGCIGEFTSDIDVLFPLQLFGLEKTLCNEASPVRFIRDTTLATYIYTIDSTAFPNPPNPNDTILEIVEFNIIDYISTQDSSHNAAITTISIIPNNEAYTLDPQNAVLNNVDTVVIEMHYIASRTITQYIDSGLVTSIDTIQSPPSIIEYPIRLVDRPQLSFDLDTTFYCKNAALDHLNPNPILEFPYSSFSYTGSNTALGPFTLADSLPRDTFNANSIYNDLAVSLNQIQSQDLYVQLTYTVARYGCVDYKTQNTKIIRPVASSLSLNGSFSSTSRYCNSASPISLVPQNTISNALGVGAFLVDGIANSPLIDSTDQFFPSRAQSQEYEIVYQFIDSVTGCVSTSSPSIISIREPAVIQLEIDGNFTNPRICANRDTALLNMVLISGSGSNIAPTYNRNNLIISGDTLKPFDSYTNANIIETIRVNYTDSFSCLAYYDLSVEVYKPSPRMNGFLSTVNNTYCNNDDSFFIVETPVHLVGDIVTGAGVALNNGIYSYDPNLITGIPVNSFIIDTVRYDYTDALGCSAFTESIVQVNSIPGVSLTGLDTGYCVNDIAVQLTGTSSTLFGNTRYIGAGIDNGGLFSPATAGIGMKEIIYSFTDGNGCEDTVIARTVIHALPSAQFTFPQSQYCIGDTRVRLDTISPMGIYTFWGSIIDSAHIITPQDTTGQQIVHYSLTDSLGCSDISSTTIFVHPLPEITINGLDSVYCFNSPIANIVISPILGGTILVSAAGFSLNSTGVTFTPNQDSSGVKIFNYAYTDNVTNCSDTVVFNTTVYDVPIPSYTGIDSVYCAIDSLYSITGIPAGGVFSGAGVSNTGNQYYFNPIFTGGGNRTLNYRVDTTILHNATYLLSCPVDIDIPIVINQLPNLLFSGPGNNNRFCSNEADILLGGLELSPTWRLFTSSTSDAIDRIVSLVVDSVLLTVTVDTSYFFSPSDAGEGRHNITYIARDSLTGCLNTEIRTYYVTDYGTGASFVLDSVYCASNDSIFLIGNPNGGGFRRNEDVLSSSYLTLNTSTYLLDTIIYDVTYDACTASDTQLVEIKPLVELSFVGNKGSKTYCFGDDDSPLVPNISGGTFTGSAVISGDSLFSLQYANAGDNIINYTFIDSATYCESTKRDTFFVFGMPNISFQAIGGCQLDSIFFHPDNLILGLNNTFGSRIIDSITDITWELEPGLFINGTSNSNNEIDSINHIYTTPGVYETKLYVANRTHCVDTNTVRVVISPTIASNQFPYDETFENSNGNWYAEAKDSSHNLLWEWGRDTIPLGVNEPNNKIWVTELNNQYTANEAAWVYSPCFDISDLERPMIRFDYWSDSRDRGDGTVLEFQNLDGSWSPLGELYRGIHWFNSDFIAGSPGNQILSPIGWSGQKNDWINSRYKLDEFKAEIDSKLRLRMAFGSSAINLGSFYNGFAFDNVWIGNRTRNVLLETTSNINEPNMDYINNYVYQLAYHSTINKDVILLQYHSEAPSDNDEFHQFDIRLGNVKPYIYGIPDAGTSFIDGINNTRSRWLDDLSFEQNMLESPEFEIVIDSFQHMNQPDLFTMVVTVTALVDIPAFDRYRINMIITEDSLSYLTGEKVHAVVRKDYPSDVLNTFNRSWVTGEQVTLRKIYSASDLNYVPNHFQAVAFIQAEKSNARKVFQAATTRDVSGYWVGVDQVDSEKELNEIKDMTLYPNPASDYINIDFSESLTKDYNWKLITIGGITVKEGAIQAGEQSLKINNYDFPSGVYVFMVYNNNVYSQRKVIINQD